MKSSKKAVFLLLIVSVIWGAASPVVKHTLTWFDPYVFLLYRFFISSIIALAQWTYAGVHAPKNQKHLILSLLAGAVSAPISLFIFFAALEKTTALSGSLLTAIGPLLIVFGGSIFFHDHVTRKEQAGIAIALLGTLVTIVGPVFGIGSASPMGNVTGNSLMVLAITLDAIGALLTKAALKERVSSSFIVSSQFLLGFLVFIPLVLYRMSLWELVIMIKDAPLEAHLGVLYMAVISGSIAYFLRNTAIQSIEVSESAIFSYLQPIWAAILAILWLHETITPAYLLGGGIIAIGVVVSELRLRQNAKSVFSPKKARHR